MTPAPPDFVETFKAATKAIADGKKEEAAALCKRCAEIDPTLWLSLAQNELKAGNKDAALARLTEVLHSTDHPFLKSVALVNVGLLMSQKGKRELAMDLWLQGLSLNPQNAELYGNIGHWHYWRGNYDEAKKWLNEALRIRPGFPHALFCLGLIHLIRGEWEQGWKFYEHRWDLGSHAKPVFNVPEWDGQPTDKRVLIYMEQGVGDEIHFSRYFPLARARTGGLSYVCHTGMSELLRRSFPFLDMIYDDPRGTVDVPPDGPYDLVFPLMSLPGLFMPEIPPTPYLNAPGVSDQCGGQMRVGIVWGGGLAHEQDLFRSIPWKQFREVLGVDGVNYYSFQRGPYALDLADDSVIDLGPGLLDWTDTAIHLRNMDLLVSCDTSVAHLAGALNIPTLLLMPPSGDFRWGTTGEETPWYPSVRLLRAAKDLEWSGVVAEARSRVETLSQLLQPGNRLLNTSRVA